MTDEAREQAEVEKLARLLFLTEYPEHKEWDTQTIRLQCPLTYNKCLVGAKALYDAGYRHIDPEKLTVLSDEAKIICLCGSTRFTEQMLIKQWELTKQGNVVLSWCALPDSYFNGEDRAHIGDQEGVKKIVDQVHFRKIDLCDEVLVINIGGYIGESTTNEINYAKKLGKPVHYLDSPSSP